MAQCTHELSGLTRTNSVETCHQRRRQRNRNMVTSSSREPSNSFTVERHYDDETMLNRQEILQRIGKKRYNMRTGDMVEFPPLNRREDLPAWIARVEEDLMTGDVIPRSQWSDAAIVYLTGYKQLKIPMMQERARIEAGGLDIWIWEDFKEYLSQVLGKVTIQQFNILT